MQLNKKLTVNAIVQMGKNMFLKLSVYFMIVVCYFLGFLFLLGTPLFLEYSYILHIQAAVIGLFMVGLNTLFLVGVVKKSSACLLCYLVMGFVISFVGTIEYILISCDKNGFISYVNYRNSEKNLIGRITSTATALMVISWVSLFSAVCYYLKIKEKDGVASNKH